MGEALLGPSESSKEIAEHRQHVTATDGSRHDRALGVVEAVLLALVALLAAWSGYASAKWSTESRVLLSSASTARSEANRASERADTQREFDSSTFDAWFTAFVAGNEEAMRIAERRFRPGFAVAFEAWLATDPMNNPDAPPGPTYVEEYRQPELAVTRKLDAKADARFVAGTTAGGVADDYIRVTLFLATVLFLVGISGHFRVRAARYGLLVIAVGIVVYSVVQLVGLPGPPG